MIGCAWLRPLYNFQYCTCSRSPHWMKFSWLTATVMSTQSRIMIANASIMSDMPPRMKCDYIMIFGTWWVQVQVFQATLLLFKDTPHACKMMQNVFLHNHRHNHHGTLEVVGRLFGKLYTNVHHVKCYSMCQINKVMLKASFSDIFRCLDLRMGLLACLTGAEGATNLDAGASYVAAELADSFFWIRACPTDVWCWSMWALAENNPTRSFDLELNYAKC